MSALFVSCLRRKEINTARSTTLLLSLLMIVSVFVAPGTGAAAEGQEEAKTRYPTLEDRGLGEAVQDSTGQRKIWPHNLPFFAQKITDLGFELPNTFGVTLIGAYIRQDLLLSDLQISTDGTNFTSIDFIEFPGVDAEDVAMNLKLDAWILPFLNVYAMGGYVNGKADLTVGIPGDDLMSFLGLGGLCHGGPLEPDICNQTIALIVKPEYHGFTYGVGGVLAMGWRGWFVAVPATWIWTDLNITSMTISTFNSEILIGRGFPLGGAKVLEVFIGTQYLDATYEAQGVQTIPLSDSDPSLEDVDIYYKLHETNKDKWNFIVGANYQINRHWDIQTQVGFLGSRELAVLTGVYRW